MEQNEYINIYKRNTKNIKLKIINIFMVKGLKEISEKNLFNLLKLLNKSNKKKISFLLKNFLIKHSLFLNIKTVKRKKKIFTEIPYLVKPKLRLYFAIKNVLTNIKHKYESFRNKMMKEIIKVLTKKSSNSFKILEDSYKNAFTKKAFAHYRWF